MQYVICINNVVNIASVTDLLCWLPYFPAFPNQYHLFKGTSQSKLKEEKMLGECGCIVIEKEQIHEQNQKYS